jgi:hypothetical protein
MTLRKIQRSVMTYPTYINIQNIERYSIECRNTRTKVITLTNLKGHRQPSEPILSSKQIHADGKKLETTCASESRLLLI